MNYKLGLVLSAMILSAIPGVVLAQDYDYHPILSDNFTASLGFMRSSNAFKLESDVTGDPGDDIDFDDALDVSDHSTFFNGQLRWKFGSERKWSISGQYFSNSAKGDAVLEEDVEWDGLIFREGTFVASEVKIAVTRVFVGRSFIKNDQNDFGLGIGIHNLDISAYVEGEVIIDDESTGVQRGEVDANQPLPNIGGWYNYSPAKNWLLHARVDWISANIGDYDGSLWNASAGVGYQVWRNVGFDLSWQWFGLDLKVDSDDWRGRTKMTYSGPVVAVNFSW
ncbi:MAG: hypothetical protein QNK19_13725 [Xanthomonadales bacterium]|nr:hypothetical protein [Xanthomonadales bacterium]